MEAKVTVSFPAMAASGDQDYEVWIGQGLLDDLAIHLDAACSAHRYAVIADRRVADIYGEAVLIAARAAGARVDLFTFPAGEVNKTRESWAALSDELLGAGLGRDAAVLALGGGVTGDLAGFVAATFLRGLPLIQLPTTLLAMIDSSVGGKTGVDTAAGKNLIGSFHQPRRVIADTATLATLPRSEIRSGLAEGIKHGAIADAGYFHQAAADADRLLALDPEALIRFIQRSVEIKVAVVSADEREGGIRKTLNFGHTIGHAVEALSEFTLLHGEAVAIGMVAEAKIGEAVGITEAGTAAALERSLTSFGLPTCIPSGFSSRAILEYTRLDKKARAGRVEYALLEGIGRSSRGPGSYGVAVEDEVVKEVLSFEF